MSQKIPQHVAIVMDGNGRWAETRGLSRSDGQRAGLDVVKTIVQGCLEKKIATLSLFAFGCENWSRPSEEVEFLMSLFITAIEKELKDLNEQGVCLRFVGDRTRLSAALCEQMVAAEALTSNHQKLFLNIAVNYSGKWDIVQASRKLVARVLDGHLDLSDLDEKRFECELSTGILPAPDLFIRTSGEQRISNFFLWQLAYTEFYFTDVQWPEFTMHEFDNALSAFSHRERRYGLTSKQLLEPIG